MKKIILLVLLGILAYLFLASSCASTAITNLINEAKYIVPDITIPDKAELICCEAYYPVLSKKTYYKMFEDSCGPDELRADGSIIAEYTIVSMSKCV
jgi:hypothetical protein